MLWDLLLYIQFPPGSLILIPSATLIHSNTPVGQEETRASFTQYCGGGLFRYADNDFQTDKDLKASNPEKYVEVLGQRRERWALGISLLSTIDDLVPQVS